VRAIEIYIDTIINGTKPLKALLTKYPIWQVQWNFVSHCSIRLLSGVLIFGILKD
jgi:hypothetical protein